VALAQALGGRGASAKAQKQQLRDEVTWLRKTPILGNNLYEAVHKQQKENTERQHVVSASRELATVPQGKKTLQEQVDAIEKTFDEAQAIDREGAAGGLKHPTKPELTAAAVLPVLPDYECWCNQYVHMRFDIDPQDARSGEALLKGFSHKEAVGATEIKHEFLAYLLPKPTDDLDADEEGRELEWVREYAYKVNQGNDAEYFLSMQEGGVVYNQFNGNISLTRKTFQNVMASRPSKITLARRELEAEEQTERESQKEAMGGFLLPPPSQVLALTHKPD